jgi:hypothetical protein
MADVTGDYYANESGIGYGTELGVGQGDAVPPTTPETFVSVPVMMKITPGDLTTGVVDATHLRSPNRHREKKGTIRDSGAIVCEGFYVPGHGAHNMAGGDGFDETQLVDAAADDFHRLVDHLPGALQNGGVCQREPDHPAFKLRNVEIAGAGGVDHPADRLRQLPKLRISLADVLVANADLDRITPDHRGTDELDAGLAQDPTHVILHAP